MDDLTLDYLDEHAGRHGSLYEADPDAVYACINYGEACAPGEIQDRSTCMDADIGEVLRQL